jgi:hypothetical protein
VLPKLSTAPLGGTEKILRRVRLGVLTGLAYRVRLCGVRNVHGMALRWERDQQNFYGGVTLEGRYGPSPLENVLPVAGAALKDVLSMGSPRRASSAPKGTAGGDSAGRTTCVGWVAELR